MKSTVKRVLSMLLAVVMILCAVPLSVFAAPVTLPDNVPLASQKESTLAPGVTLHEIVAYNGDGGRCEIYVTETDMSSGNYKVYANNYNNQVEVPGLQRITDQAAAFEANHPGEEVIITINGSYYNMSNGEPNGAMVMEGVEMPNRSYDPNARPFFAVLKDGSFYIGYNYNAMKDQIQEAVGGECLLIDNGVIRYDLISAKGEAPVGLKYPRQTIGITADGKIITMTADGYRAPTTCGLSIEEQAEVMLSLGCVYALHLDGGGSAGLAVKQEGSDELTIANTPGDRYERNVSNSIVIVSTAVASDTFDHAALEAENDYVTPGSTVAISASGVSTTGHSAEIPAGVTLQVKEAAMGSIVDGKYVAADTFTGDAVVQMTLNGEVVGETTVHVVIPTAVSFTTASLVAKFGSTKELVMEATINEGKTPVALKASDFTYTWSNGALGTIEGFNFIASEDTTLTAASTLTATLVHDNTVTATVVVSLTDLPDGPVLITDFEDQVGFNVNDEENFDLRHGLVDATTGQVHSGNYAYRYGYTTSDGASELPAGYSMNTGTYLGYPKGSGDIGVSFEDFSLINAVKLGFWVYFPEDAAHHYFRLCMTDGTTTKNLSVWEPGYLGLEENHRGWKYVEFDLTSYNDGSWYIKGLESRTYGKVPMDGDFYVAGYDAVNDQSFTGYVEFYLDDIYIEYLPLDIDREDPDFGDIKMSYGEVSGEVVDGQTITTNEVSFFVEVTDESKLDDNSAKAYIDGNEVDVTYGDGTMTIPGMTLADGTHTVIFEIADIHGNTDYKTRQVVVNAGSDIPTVTIKGNENNPASKELLLSGLYWVDVEVDNIEDVESIEMILNLDSCSDWELEGMEVVYGFTAEYSVNEATNDATITITKTGDVEASGHQVIAKIPARAWDYYDYYYNFAINKSGGFDDAAYMPFDLYITCDKGLVSYADGTETTFAMETIDCDTELYSYPKVLIADGKANERTHRHSAAAIADKAATCTESGYTGRTFCEGCNSVVDWGTKVPATGHKYEVVDGAAKCACGKLLTGELDGKHYVDGVALNGWVEDSYYVDGVKITGVYEIEGVCYNFGEDGVNQGKYTGLFTTGGKTYFAVAGAKKTGWQLVDEFYYCFNGTNGAALTGQQTINVKGTAVAYTFAEDGKLTSGVWMTDANNNSRYFYGPDFYDKGWQVIDGKTYCFNNGYCYKGYAYVMESYDPTARWYQFDENGALVKQITDSGLFWFNGKLYYLTNGCSTYGMHNVDGNYYYFTTSNGGAAVVDGTYYCTNTVGSGFAVGNYDFDAEGKMILKNGLYEEDGALYYYEDGVKTYAGLIQIDGDYYYIRSNYQAATGEYNVWKTNDLMPQGTYTFGEDGKMILPEPDPVKNGIVTEDGVMYYYVDGVKTYAGLIQIDGDYYYVNSKFIVVTGTYSIWKTNDLLPQGTYEFGADGKMLKDQKNGIVTEDGTMYYYVNGVKTYAGLIEIDGDYYYVNSSCKVVTGKYTIWKTNGLMPADTYTFGEDGKMIKSEDLKNGIVTEDGVMYYYVDGVKTYAGLIEIDGDYYYVNSKFTVVTGTYTIWTTNGLLPQGTYEFAADGKMIDPPVVDTNKNGIVTEDGEMYYYVDGIKTYAGLVKIDGDYYYVNSSCKVVTGSYTIWKTNDLMPQGTYEFGTDGKMIDPPVIDTAKNGIVKEDDGVMYYYVDGIKTYAGLIQIDGDYYYVNSKYVVVTGSYSIWKTNDLMPQGTYEFAADGKMITQ